MPKINRNLVIVDSESLVHGCYAVQAFVKYK